MAHSLILFFFSAIDWSGVQGVCGSVELNTYSLKSVSVWVGVRLAVEILIGSPSHLLPSLGHISVGLNLRLRST